MKIVSWNCLYGQLAHNVLIVLILLQPTLNFTLDTSKQIKEALYDNYTLWGIN